MTNSSGMITEPGYGEPDEGAFDALLLMSKRNVDNLPAGNKGDRFLRLFSLRRLPHALFPEAAQLDRYNPLMQLKFKLEASVEISVRLLDSQMSCVDNDRCQGRGAYWQPGGASV